MNEQVIGYQIKQISDKIKEIADSNFKRSQLTFTQVNVLGFLHSKGGKAYQKEIENHLNVAHPTVVGIVSRLEKNDFLKCYVDEADKRNKIVCLTEKAIAVGEQMNAEIEMNEKMLLNNLSDDDINSLRRILKTICNSLE